MEGFSSLAPRGSGFGLIETRNPPPRTPQSSLQCAFARLVAFVDGSSHALRTCQSMKKFKVTVDE